MVDVCFVEGIREFPVEEAGDHHYLTFWGEETGK